MRFRSPSVIRVRAGSEAWDLQTSISFRYAIGIGEMASSILDPNALQITANPQPASLTFHELSINIATGLEF